MILTKEEIAYLESQSGWGDFCLSKPERASQKKHILLQMAKNGEPRPHLTEHDLGRVLGFYTNVNNGCYDPEFDKQIRELRPDWFISRSERASQKKQNLLQIAKNGKPRPKQKKHGWGGMLCLYTNSKHACYDPEFDKKIRELRPDWFVTQSDGANQKKQQLLEMAKNGEPRPSQSHKLGRSFYTYTKSKEGCYDPEFSQQIKKLRPDWFVTQSDIANQKRQQLLEMAKNGEPRPHFQTSLGRALHGYTNLKRDVYNPEFDKKIKELRPDWFVTQSDGANQKKQQLLEMAKNGEPRPHRTEHDAGRVLVFYTSAGNGCYDLEFDKQIRELRPDWFISRSDGVIQKKQRLLQMAKSGELRPHPTEHDLGRVLGFYTSAANGCYDPEFDKQIRELRPDWFVSSANQKKQQLLEMATNGDSKPYHKTRIGTALSHYTHLKSGSYDSEFDKQIRELRPDWFITQSDGANQKKRQILEMAKNGEPRPTRSHKLGRFLCNYINLKNKCYDPEFSQQIKKLRPDWFAN